MKHATCVEVVNAALQSHGLPAQVESVVDIVDDLYFNVLEHDVNIAMRKDHAHCAIAQACKREFGFQSVLALRTILYLIEPGGKRALRCQLPQTLRKLLVVFDNTKHFTPGRYYVSPPEPLGKRTGGPDHKRAPHKKTLAEHHAAHAVLTDLEPLDNFGPKFHAGIRALYGKKGPVRVKRHE